MQEKKLHRELEQTSADIRALEISNCEETPKYRLLTQNTAVINACL